MKKFKLIVVRGSREEMTFAEVTGRLKNAVMDTIRDDPRLELGSYVCEALRAALTCWVVETEEGRSWYEHTTSCDANIGDVCAYGKLPDLVRQHLYSKAGIVDLEVKCVCHDDYCRNWGYDTHLVDSGVVEEAGATIMP